MTVTAGIVCGKCDLLNPVDCQTCEDCANDLKLVQVGAQVGPSSEAPENEPEKTGIEENESPPKAAQQGAEVEPMEQARHFICPSCYSPMPGGHKFCGKCGTSVEGVPSETEAKYFGDMQAPGKAKLILIKGEGMDGISYHLNSNEHVAGRTEGPILFTEDKWLSPRHANFIYDDGKLKVKDEGSVNGVFIGLKGTTEASPGFIFLAGEQVFRIDTIESYDDDAEPDGTFFFASPRTDSSFKLVQILEGGGDGMVVHSRDNVITLGREDCDMNFPNDPYISGNHVKVEMAQEKLMLTDLDSKNGTFFKIQDEHELVHGNYIFMGRQLLRVEIT